MAGFKEILNHGKNYLVANLATKALAFISIPVYTRLLSTEDYGIVNIFIGVLMIFASIMALSADRSVSRYYFDKKDHEDFKQFVGTSSILATVFFITSTIILVFFADGIGKLIGLDKKVVYLLIPMTLINIIGLTFEQIYGPLKKSKVVATSSLIRVYLGFAFSILLILIFKNEKYLGQILGQVIAGGIMVYYWVKKIKPYFIFTFRKEYIKYIFTYSIPLIPYALSGIIIAQFGKIAMGSSHGMSEAGFYSLAMNIGSLVGIVIMVTHQAWNPYFMEYMNNKNYKQVDSDFIRIFKLTIIFAFGIACFGKEIGFILAKKEFISSLHLIPIFTIGYIFYQLSYAYLRNFGYSKKTQFMTLTVLISGIFNVLTNIVLIQKYDDLGAALSFTFSYVIMTFLAWFFNYYFVKMHVTPVIKLIKPVIIASFFYLVLITLDISHSYILKLIIKLTLLLGITLSLLWAERIEILSIIKSFTKEHKCINEQNK